MTDEPVVAARGLSKRYCADLRLSMRYGVADIAGEFTLRRRDSRALRPREFWAVDDVTFDLHPGEALGIIGRNGAGKSTLLRMLAGVTRPDAGSVSISGRVGSLLSLGAGFNTTLSGRENILIEGAALGMSRRRLMKATDEIIEFSELEQFIDAPVHTYSSGMRMRLGFAIAAALDVDILLLDEVLMVGDINFRRKGVEHIKSFMEQGGCLIFVSHEMWLIQAMCNSAMHLSNGHVVTQGDITGTINSYYAELQADQDAVDAAMTSATDASSEPEGTLATTEDDESGTGEHGISIDQVTINGPGLAGTPVTGQPAEISVTVDVTAPDLRVWWAFGIWTPDRTVCITYQGTVEEERLTPAIGRHVLRGRIAAMPLMTGTYLLGILVMDDATMMPIAQHGVQGQGTLFTVETEDTERRTMQRMGGALFDVLVDFTTDGTGTSR